jgi:hypothetical protein
MLQPKVKSIGERVAQTHLGGALPWHRLEPLPPLLTLRPGCGCTSPDQPKIHRTSIGEGREGHVRGRETEGVGDDLGGEAMLSA